MKINDYSWERDMDTIRLYMGREHSTKVFQKQSTTRRVYEDGQRREKVVGVNER